MDAGTSGSPALEYMLALPTWLTWGVYVALVIVIVVFLWLLKRRVERSGTTCGELFHGVVAAVKADPRTVLRHLTVDVFAQARVRRDRWGATLHLLIFGSFGLLMIGTALVAIQHDFTDPLFGWDFLVGDFYLAFKVAMDTAGLGLIVGVVLAMWRRYRIRPSNLGGRRSVHLVYIALLYLSLSGLIEEGLRLLVSQVSWGHWAYAGDSIARALKPLIGDHILGVYQTFWWIHVIGAFCLIAAIPFVMLDHIVVVPLNLVMQAKREPGTLTTPFNLPQIMEADGDLEGVNAGIGNPVELPWRRRFMIDACIDCGRCEAMCPANAAGRSLSPRKVIQALGKDLRANVASGSKQPEEDLFARDVLEETTAWSCLTCGACARECPAWIDQPGTIVELRRHLVEEGRVDERQAGVLDAVERNQNPLGLPSYQRTDWMQGLDIPTLAENPEPEYVYWIGCMAAYDQRVRSVAKSMVKILKHAGVSFAVLGEEERCCGEAQRKLGDEAGFQMRAMENIALFESYNVVKVLTHCPHCLATLTKDYPEFGAKIEVVHHSVLLAELLESGRVPSPASTEVGKLTYHDPCNLGRLGGVFDPPRMVCEATAGSQFVELERSKDKAFCCGGGGANYFYRVPEERSVSSLRLAQVSEAGADTLATACPFCLGMLEDAAKTASDNPPRIADLAELVAAGLPEESE